MSTCADSTMLRAHLDRGDAQLEAHLDGCPACAGLLRSLAADAGATTQLLARLDHDAAGTDALDVEAALRRAVAAGGDADRSTRDARTLAALPRRGVRRFLATTAPRLGIAAALVLLAVTIALTPAGRTAIAQSLEIFRGSQLEVVTIDPAAMRLDPVDLEALQALGDVDARTGGTALEGPEQVADMAAAEALAGIRGPQLSETPDELFAAAPGTVSLTLVTRDINGVPADLDGAVLEVVIPGVIGAAYGEQDAPRLVIGRSGLVEVEATGAPLADIRAFLLERPELPEALRQQLSSIEDWQSTLPVPVPVDGPGWSEVTIAGRPGLAFGDDSGLGTLVLRTDGDGITVVGGMLGVDEALEIAAGA